MNKRFAPILIMLFTAGLMTSCSGLYDLNLFGTFDNPTPLTVEQVDNENLDTLELLLDSERVRETLDDETLDALNDNLEGIITDPDTSAEDQAAAMDLLALANLDASGGDEVVVNLVDAALTTLTNGTDLDNDANLQTMLQSIFGTDESAIADALTGLNNVEDAMAQFDASGGDAADLNADTMQAVVVGAVVDLMLASSTAADPVAALAELIAAPDAATFTSLMGSNFNDTAIETEMGLITDDLTNGTNNSTYSYVGDIAGALIPSV
jgi:hypothetical protein